MKLDVRYLSSRWADLQENKAFKKSPLTTIFRTGWWSVHCLFSVPATIQLKRWDCLFFLPPKFRRAGSTGLFVTREDYEPELAYLEQLLSPGDVFIDGGANFGIYTVVAAKLVGESGRVLSFEPGEESSAILERNVQINHLENVKIVKQALSDQEGIARFYHIDNAPNSYSLGEDAQQQGLTYEEVKTTTLVDTLNRENIERVDVIKLDVEGVEELVLRSSKSLIEKYKPSILFEISRRAISRMNLSEDGAFNFLKELGYQFIALTRDGEIISIDTPQPGNLIAFIPKSTNQNQNI